MSHVIIKAADSDATLTFCGRNGDYFTTSLVSMAVSAKKQIWGFTDCEMLVDLFRYMADNWKGWEGAANWASLENDLALSCTCDRLGHIYLATTLRDTCASARWTAHFTIMVEAGQLASIAADVAGFFDTRAPARH